MRLLTPYGVETLAERPKLLATLTAGYRELGKDWKLSPPRRTKDGEIYVHCKTVYRVDPKTGEMKALPEAQGLIDRLEQNGRRWLRITFPSNRLEDVFHQRLVRYSATRLEVVGDGESLTEIRQDGQRVVHPAGSEEYARLARTCKGEYSIYFVLADYVDGGVQMDMPDGMGYYRIRCASRNTARRFFELWNMLCRYTADRETGEPRLVGIPVDISLAKEEVVTPEGVRREAFIWQFEMRLPGGRPITSRVLPSVMMAAIQESRRLSLPSPSEVLEEADSIDTTVALTECEPEGEPLETIPADDVEGDPLEDMLDRRCDAAHYRRAWHATVEGTPWDSDEARHQWFRDYTNGRAESLSAFLDSASEDEALQMLNTIREQVAAWRERAERASLMDELRGALNELGVGGPAKASAWLGDRFHGASKVAHLTTEQLRQAVEIAMEELGAKATK